jgi:hypothetical protein
MVERRKSGAASRTAAGAAAATGPTARRSARASWKRAWRSTAARRKRTSASSTSSAAAFLTPTAAQESCTRRVEKDELEHGEAHGASASVEPDARDAAEHTRDERVLVDTTTGSPVEKATCGAYLQHERRHLDRKQ